MQIYYSNNKQYEMYSLYIQSNKYVYNTYTYGLI